MYPGHIHKHSRAPRSWMWWKVCANQNTAWLRSTECLSQVLPTFLISNIIVSIRFYYVELPLYYIEYNTYILMRKSSPRGQSKGIQQAVESGFKPKSLRCYYTTVTLCCTVSGRLALCFSAMKVHGSFSEAFNQSLPRDSYWCQVHLSYNWAIPWQRHFVHSHAVKFFPCSSFPEPLATPS